jgi:hypothetical protein
MDWTGEPAYRRPEDKRIDMGLLIPGRWSNALREIWTIVESSPSERDAEITDV